MTPLETTLWLALACLGLAGSAMCSGMETGLYSLNRARLTLETRRRDAKRARTLDREADHADRSIAALLIANNAFNYLGVLGVTALLGLLALAEWQVIILNALIVTPLLLVFAESMPKELFRRSANRFMLALTPLLVGLRLLFTAIGALPLVLLIARAAGRLTGLPAEPELGVRQRIAEMLKQDGHVLSAAQADLIDRALAFRRMTVERQMTPWSRVDPIRLSWDRARVVGEFERHPHRRYPAIDADGSVRGIVDSLRVLADPQAPIRTLVESAPTIEPRAPAREALALLRDESVGMAIVRRPDGPPLGVVTPKDLVEPLTGQLLAW